MLSQPQRHTFSSAMKSLRQVNEIVQRLYPPSLAGSWDNVGLLWEPAHQRPSASRVMLCIDLTTPVVDEILEDKSIGHVVAYHPPIFRGLKRFTANDPQQRSMMRLASAGIGLICVHTSADAIPGGVNDWLAHVIAGQPFDPRKLSALQVQPLEKADTSKLSEAFRGAGAGRLLTLPGEHALCTERRAMSIVMDHLKQGLQLRHLQYCPGSVSHIYKKVAICAGSGGSLFESSPELIREADLLVTGELSHHEVLRYQAMGKTIILTGHSNSERGYLHHMKTLLEDEGLEVMVSRADRDPLDTY